MGNVRYLAKNHNLITYLEPQSDFIVNTPYFDNYIGTYTAIIDVQSYFSINYPNAHKEGFIIANRIIRICLGYDYKSIPTLMMILYLFTLQYQLVYSPIYQHGYLPLFGNECKVWECYVDTFQ